MDRDVAEHPGGLGAAILSRFRKQFQEVRNGGQAGARVLSCLLRFLDRFSQAEQRIRKSVPPIADLEPCAGTLHPDDRLTGRPLPA